MKSEVRDAAEVYREAVERWRNKTDTFDDCCMLLESACAICDAVLPEFDETPVDEEWLRSVGFIKDERHDSKWFLDRKEGLPIGLWKVDDGFKVMLLHTDCHASCLVRRQNTRGRLLTLLRAVGGE